jgi:hypothetical protein
MVWLLAIFLVPYIGVAPLSSNAGLPEWQDVPDLTKCYALLYYEYVTVNQEEIFVISGTSFCSTRPLHDASSYQ